ncbi:MAG: capsule assembly Wzi family protein [Balneolaceae bacterium]
MVRLLPSIFILIIALAPANAFSQFSSDKWDVELGLYSTLSSEQYQSFWLTHNRWGLFDDESANLLGSYSLRKPMNVEGLFGWEAGVNLVGRISDYSLLSIPEGFLEGRYRFLHLQAGRFRQTHGETFGEISSGSAGMSRNATPVPRVTLSIPEFQEIPYTEGWLEVKGHMSHGWLTDSRLGLRIPEYEPIGLEGSYLHDKSFYLRTGADTGFKFYLGLNHFAEWGGTTDEGRELPSSFQDFLRIFSAREGTGDAPGLDQVNALGAHTGLWDLGVQYQYEGREFYLYYQHLFADESGQKFRNAKDGLYGFGVSNPLGESVYSDLLSGVVWEFLYTKHQTGPGLPDPQAGDNPSFCEEVNCGYRFNGRDDYYNNDYYLSGWSYHSRAIGSPLFMTRDQLGRIDPDINVYSDRYFVSTRVVAHHIGLEGTLPFEIPYRFLATWNRHYGTYWGRNLGKPWGSLDPSNDPEEYFFNPPMEQWYLMFEAEYRLPRADHISLQGAIGLDRGDLFQNTGLMLGIRFRK